MSANEALHTQQFHGARQGIDDTHVRPPSVTGAYAASSHGFSGGGGKHAGTPHTDLAFSTNSEHTAWSYARHSGSTVGHPVNHDPDPKHRGRVYAVEPAHDQDHDGGRGEIASPTGFRMTGVEHHSARGVTSTFHEVNWNAYKGAPKKGSAFAHSQDANHAYMDVHAPTHHLASGDTPPRTEPTVHPVKEGGDEYGNKHRVDQRNPNQLNLFSGRTVAEHNAYNGTPGAMLHMSPEQFPDAPAFHRDPTTSTIRKARDYHRQVDEKLGTVV